MFLDQQTPNDAELIGSRIGRVDPDNFRSERGEDDNDGLDEDITDDEPNEDLHDEPVDEDGDPTGEHDHHQDDNYALGGHVTRSGS